MKYASMRLAIEVYQEHEDSYFTQDGIEYSVNYLLRLTHSRKAKPFELEKVRWLIEENNQTTDPSWDKREAKAELQYPILVWNSKTYGWVVVDGMHRTTKALKLGYKTLPAHILTDSEMEIARKK